MLAAGPAPGVGIHVLHGAILGERRIGEQPSCADVAGLVPMGLNLQEEPETPQEPLLSSRQTNTI